MTIIAFNSALQSVSNLRVNSKDTKIIFLSREILEAMSSKLAENDTKPLTKLTGFKKS